jgi:DNA-binding transcriptional regulator YiaG
MRAGSQAFIPATLISSLFICIPPIVPKPLDPEIAAARQRRAKAAAQLAAEDAALEALFEAQRRLIDVIAEEHRVLDLHTQDEQSTVKHMDAAISPKRIGRPITSKHPFPARCAELGLSVKDAAAKLGVSPSTLRSWYAEPPDGRPIPEDMAAKLAKAPWGIPARAWKNRPSK